MDLQVPGPTRQVEFGEALHEVALCELDFAYGAALRTDVHVKTRCRAARDVSIPPGKWGDCCVSTALFPDSVRRC